MGMDLNKLDLPATEADVVIVLYNDGTGSVKVVPQWESDTPAGDKMVGLMAAVALEFSEECGGGATTAAVFDRRGSAEG